MDNRDKELLEAIHEVDKKVETLQVQLDETVHNRFNEHDRRISMLESNQRWVVLAVIGSAIAAIMSMIMVGG